MASGELGHMLEMIFGLAKLRSLSSSHGPFLVVAARSGRFYFFNEGIQLTPSCRLHLESATRPEGPNFVTAKVNVGHSALFWSLAITTAWSQNPSRCILLRTRPERHLYT